MQLKRPQIGKITPKKDTFLFIFLILVVMLSFLPVFSTFNDLLTRFVMSLDAYQVIQKYVVPWLVRMVGVLLWPFGFAPRIMGEYLAIGGEKPFLIEIAWNCIGWQSLLFFILTAWIGFQGEKYTLLSKIKAWIIGFLGTFLVNLVRIAIVALLAYYFSQNVALVFHDYGSTLAVIGWLFLFWWLAYNFVLEEKS